VLLNLSDSKTAPTKRNAIAIRVGLFFAPQIPVRALKGGKGAGVSLDESYPLRLQNTRYFLYIFEY
jgi:hypothetical protein